MRSVRFQANTEKIRGPDFTDFFMNRKITIAKQWKGNVIGFSKMGDFIVGITRTDPDQFDSTL